MSKKVKQMQLAALKKTFEGVRDMVFLSPDRVDSGTEYAMRKTLRDKKIRIMLVKNSFGRKIFNELGINVKDTVWSGPTLIAWGSDSVKELSKAVDALMKDLKKDPKAPEKLKFKTAIADGQECTLEAAMKMPTRQEAIAEILSCILGPASAVAGCLTGPASAVASQIATLAEPKPEAAPSA